MCLNAKSHFQNNQARKKTREPKDHYCGRTSKARHEDENPPPVDVDSDVQKKGCKGVNQIYRRIMSESDNDVTITKKVRKESRPITISDKVWFIVKRDACDPLI